jgi:hypothetical protein
MPTCPAVAGAMGSSGREQLAVLRLVFIGGRWPRGEVGRKKERRARDGERGSGVEEHAGTCGSPLGPTRPPTEPSARRRGNDRARELIVIAVTHHSEVIHASDLTVSHWLSEYLDQEKRMVETSVIMVQLM